MNKNNVRDSLDFPSGFIFVIIQRKGTYKKKKYNEKKKNKDDVSAVGPCWLTRGGRFSGFAWRDFSGSVFRC